MQFVSPVFLYTRILQITILKFYGLQNRFFAEKVDYDFQGSRSI
jgi:hypothetical protein